MAKKSGWERLGDVLHCLSYLKLAFYGAGIYYQLQTMVFGNREHFTHNLCSTMLMYGLAMLLEALRDNERIALQRKKQLPRLALIQGVVFVATPLFLFAVLVGVLMLFRVGDRYQGESIIAFGVGGLALMRLEYDCLNLTKAHREALPPTPDAAPEVQEAEAPAPVAD